MVSALDFPLLDDVLPLFDMGEPKAETNIRAAKIYALGPLIEYAYQAHKNTGVMPPLSELTLSAPVRELRRVLACRNFGSMACVPSHQARNTELHWIPTASEEFSSPTWTMFQRRLQNAAERSGFSRRLAAGLTGAFGEMVDNASRHSLKPSTAVAGYRWSAGSFEYVVADAGRGVLASLRSCADYTDLRDCGNALQLALTDGESCLGRHAERGRGFRQVFLSLGSLTGYLRFRSGDHVLMIDGTSPDLSRARLVQVGIDYTGFLVSVTCRPS